MLAPGPYVWPVLEYSTVTKKWDCRNTSRWIFLHRTSLFWTSDKNIQGTVDGLHLPACLDGFHRILHSFDLACVYLEDSKGDGDTEIADADRQTLCFSAFSLRLDACLFCLCFSPLVPVLTDRSSRRGSHLEVNCDYEDLSFTVI